MAAKAGAIEIKEQDWRTISVRIYGKTELITHPWSEKAKRMMADAQAGVARKKKEPKIPEDEYEAALYKLPDGSYGMAATAFKAAIVDGCRLSEGLPMTLARTIIMVEGEPGADGQPLVRIEGQPRMRCDMVRLETGVADLRYRPGFPTWAATLKVTYLADMLTPDMLVNLINNAGAGGVGEWRPNSKKGKSGWAGTFRVDRSVPVSIEKVA